MAPVVCLAGALLLPSAAYAHKFNAKRTVLLEAWPEALHVAIILEVPSGRASSAARLIAPTNKALSGLLAERALDSLTLALDGRPQKLGEVEVKVAESPNPKDPLRFMLRGVIALPQKVATVTVETGKSGDATVLQLLGGKRPFSSPSRGKLHRGGMQTELGTRDRIKVTVPAAGSAPVAPVAPPDAPVAVPSAAQPAR